MGEAPAGTITFLFTDIEGSTRLWQAHPEHMPGALAQHDGLARAAVVDHGGELFKHTGDGICAAFGDARAAVTAAVALQRALANASWGDGPRPRVRIALDSGTAQRRQGDYFGPTLNRAARVLGSASGGQIVATDATMSLAPEMDHVDLGLHRLRDLGEPVRLAQIVAPGLERTFPPLRTLERFRHSLPVVRSSFVGREHEIARVRRLLASSRLLTITGVGGCGKTRLALAVVAQELESFPDGVFFVDLSAVTSDALVWSTIASTLGLSGGELAPREVVLARLRGTTTCLVLDNCEHLLDACVEVGTALAELAGSVAVVATSREPLGIEGEQVYRIPSLGLPADDADPASSEAVRLFVERATAVDAGFTLGPVAATVVDICRRLDGIPLAIELAAARVRHLSPAEIARRLDDRFRLLTSGPRGARQRQQTLGAALDWSFQLLTERERTLLRRCAVFVDGFSLAAAEGICADDVLPPADVVDVLGALVDKSLVSLHATDGRYRLLETIRLYALDRLVEANELPALRTRHLVWFERTYDTVVRDPAATLDLENLRAAREWAQQLSDGERVARLTRELFWHSATYEASLLDERAWCRTALAHETLSPQVRAETLAIASFRDIGVGDWDSAIANARSAIALAPEPGEGFAVAAYGPLAIGLMVTDPEAADRAIDEGFERVRRARAPAFSEPMLASLRIGTALMRGDARGAVERGRLAGDSHGFMSDPLGVAFALHLLGDHDGADADARRRPLLNRSSGLGQHGRHLLYALTAAARGEREVAGRELAAAAALVRRYRYPLTLNDCIVVCGAIAALERRFERASVLLAAVADHSAVRAPETWAVYLHYRGIVRAALDAATVHRCREEARAVDLDRALDEELARFGPDA